MDPVARLRDDELAIFLFHGVVEEHRHPVRNYTRKHIDRARFVSVLDALRRDGTPVAMDEIVANVIGGAPFPRRAFAVTFDDGFENNLTVAAPILDDMRIPATFYVTTSFIDQNAMSWIDRIEWCFEAAPRIGLRLPWRSDRADASDAISKIALLSEIRSRVKADRAIDVDALVASIFAQCGCDEIRTSDDPLDQKMSWSQLRQLADYDRFTVGGHSHTHAILSFLEPQALAQELDVSFSLLSSRAGIGPRHYSYPEGLRYCYSSAVIAALQARGVVCCPTAEDGTNPPGSELFRLKRIMVD